MPRVRKSAQQGAKASKQWSAGLYIRLSKEDGNNESYSVINQRLRLTAHLDELRAHEDISLAGCYIDDGCTGIDSNRDGFQRLLGDIDSGGVNCVIVKDLSRLSRNDWECKHYLQHLFVIRGVRFISLELPALDSYKSPDDVYGLGVTMQSTYNETHCRETSVKVRGTFAMKRRRGDFIGAFAPYGYQKHPENKSRLIIDEETAPTVRDIFSWYVAEGMSKRGIARRLNELGVPNPTAYKQQVQRLRYQNPCARPGGGLWSEKTIAGILQNQMYIGSMVQGRQRKLSYQLSERIRPPEEEWDVVPNMHQAIVGEDLFAGAQRLHARDTRTAPGRSEPHLFAGLLRCPDCGRALRRHSSKGLAYFHCRTASDKGGCAKRSIREDALTQAVLAAIRMQLGLARSLDETIEAIRRLPAGQAPSDRLHNTLRLRQTELDKVTAASDSLYIDWRSGELTEEEYRRRKASFAEKAATLKAAAQKLREEIDASAGRAGRDDPYLAVFLSQGNIPQLNRGILTELVDAVYLHKNGGITIDFAFEDELKRSLSSLEDNPGDLSLPEGQAF